MVVEPEEGFLDVGGYKIHFLKWGTDGPKLVFIHSMGMDARGFDITSRVLSGEYQILALDILDHGDSESPKEPVSLPEHAEIMRKAYMKMKFKPNVLVGHSVGGMIGMVLAADHPKDFNGMVLVDIAPFTMSGEGRSSQPRPQPVNEYESLEEARAYFKERYGDFVEEAIENRLQYGLIKGNDGIYRRKPTGDAIRGGLSTDLWPYVERMKGPIFLMKGGTSNLVTPETLNRMKRLLRDLQVATFDGVGHMIPQGKPEEFERHLRNYLNSLNL